MLDARLESASEEQVSRLEEQKSKLDIELKSRDEKLAELQEQLERYQFDASDPKRQAEVKQLKWDLEDVRNDLEERDRQLKSAESRRAAAEKEREGLEKELQRRDADAAAAHRDAREAALEREALREELETKQQDLEDAERKLSNREPIRWRDLREVFSKGNVLILVVLLLMLGLVVLSLIAASEIQGRQQLAANVQRRIDDAQQQFVSAGADAETNGELKSELQELRRIRSDAGVLIAAGAASDHTTLSGLSQRLLEIDSPGASESMPEQPTGMQRWLYFVCYQDSDLLLSFVVVVAGCIGAIIAAMREDVGLTFQDLGLGLGAGLITFLVIRSGRAVFLLNPGGATFVLNPYTSAFFGLAAGLFTERAYSLLTKLIDETIRRLQNAFIDNGAEVKKTDRTVIQKEDSPDANKANSSEPQEEDADDDEPKQE